MSNERQRNSKKANRRTNRVNKAPQPSSTLLAVPCEPLDSRPGEAAQSVPEREIIPQMETAVVLENVLIEPLNHIIESIEGLLENTEVEPRDGGDQERVDHEIGTGNPLGDDQSDSIGRSATESLTIVSTDSLPIAGQEQSTNELPRDADVVLNTISPPVSSSGDGTAWSNAVESKLNSLIEQSKAFERERIEIESLREQLRTAIDTAESRLTESNGESLQKCATETELLLIEAKQEIARLSTYLLHSRNEYQALVEFIESEPQNGSPRDEVALGGSMVAQCILDKAEARETELLCEVGQLNEQLMFLQEELRELREMPTLANCDDAELRIQIEKLRSQLLEARHDAVELRLQNNELGSRLAKFQGPAESQRAEALSWEQRKEALLQQLEAETKAETPCDPRAVLDIERVIEQTDAEIERRDREIADLRSLLEQQAYAHNGMAVGVAAVAEMIESDAMIIAERVRLQELQKDWEQKQRQAEIEMSLERAKLARERLELQEKLRNFEEANPPQTEDEKKIGKERNRGRWLARLGLSND